VRRALVAAVGLTLAGTAACSSAGSYARGSAGVSLSPASSVPSAASSGAPSAGASGGSSAPLALPSGPTTVAPGETLAAFWARLRVTPAPPADFLDAYAGIALPSTSPVVAAAVRGLAGRDWALDHLRLDLVDAGVLGAVGLSGADASVTEATSRGITSLSSSLSSVTAAKVVDVPAAQVSSLDTTIVVLRVSYGPTVGTYADGTSATAPPDPAKAIAIAGHLVTDRLLGTFLYETQTVDCASAVAGGPVAAACAGF
jgi:hypothetical protein